MTSFDRSTNNFLEDVSNLEAQAFEQGQKIGISDGWNKEMLESGIKGGFNKGYPLGIEIGFIEASEKYSIDNTIASTTVATDSDLKHNTEYAMPNELNLEDDSSGGPSADFLLGRKQRRKEALLSSINNLPLYNSSAVDFEAELRELRATYRMNGTKLGNFLRPNNTGNSSAW